MIYVSDLDGTLLDSKGGLSDFTINTVNSLIDDGMKFTIASARSIFTAAEFIDKINFTLPLILRNGAFVYEPSDRKVLQKKLLERDRMIPVLDFFTQEGLKPIVHHTDGENLFVDYTKIENYGERHYIESRLRAGDRRFRNVSEYKYGAGSEFISMCVIGENSRQDMLFEKVFDRFPKDYIIHKYLDTYSGYTWIEINHPEATKENAISYVMEYLGEDEYIAFGDNINDLGMLEGASEAVIPSGSHLDTVGNRYIKSRPIDSDGVARKLLEYHKSKE